MAETLDKSGYFRDPLDEIMGTDEAAKLWGLSAVRVKHLCSQGKVKAKKIGKTWVIDRQQENPRKGGATNE